MKDIIELLKKIKKASKEINMAKTKQKDQILINMKNNLTENIDNLLKENIKDIEKAKEDGLKEILIERLKLTYSRVEDMIRTLQEIIFLRDPVGELVSGNTAKSGLKIEKIRVPLGVIGIIYESRPNITVDALALSIKSGNSVILKGGKEATKTNSFIVSLMVDAIEKAGVSSDIIGFIETSSREDTLKLTKFRDYIDVIIPRGGKELIEAVVSSSTVPVIETGYGNCHIYVDEFCDIDMAIDIVVNAKTSRPSVCNAAESLLVHEALAKIFLERLWQEFKKYSVKIVGCEKTLEILKDAQAATEEDYYTEYLDFKMSVKIVSSVNDAIDHISKYSSKHSEAIITSNYFNAEKFLKEVDSAAVYVNASTRFTDGGQFGLGAEIGISTQKLHARGPMGLFDLTTTKTIIRGSGQIR